MSREGLRPLLRRHADLRQRRLPAGGRRPGAGRAAAGGDRRALPDPDAVPGPAELLTAGAAHGARACRGDRRRARPALRRSDRYGRARLRKVGRRGVTGSAQGRRDGSTLPGNGTWRWWAERSRRVGPGGSRVGGVKGLDAAGERYLAVVGGAIAPSGARRVPGRRDEGARRSRGTAPGRGVVRRTTES